MSPASDHRPANPCSLPLVRTPTDQTDVAGFSLIVARCTAFLCQFNALNGVFGLDLRCENQRGTIASRKVLP